MRLFRHPSRHQAILTLLVLLILTPLLVSCSSRDCRTGRTKNLSIKSCISKPSKSAAYTIAVEIASTAKKDDVTTDVWANVLPGLSFSAGPAQTVTEDGRQITRPGLVLRPGASVEIAFSLTPEPSLESGTQIIYTFVKEGDEIVQSNLPLKITKR